MSEKLKILQTVNKGNKIQDSNSNNQPSKSMNTMDKMFQSGKTESFEKKESESLFIFKQSTCEASEKNNQVKNQQSESNSNLEGNLKMSTSIMEKDQIMDDSANPKQMESMHEKSMEKSSTSDRYKIKITSKIFNNINVVNHSPDSNELNHSAGTQFLSLTYLELVNDHNLSLDQNPKKEVTEISISFEEFPEIIKNLKLKSNAKNKKKPEKKKEE